MMVRDIRNSFEHEASALTLWDSSLPFWDSNQDALLLCLKELTP